MKRIYFILFAAVFSVEYSVAQISVTYIVNTSMERHSISPYIYGINNGSYHNATFRRLGGNRLSAYNWENNFSNAGIDYINENDNYMPWAMGLPLSEYLNPAACIVAFHDTSLAQGAASGITLPMVGWVSNDDTGVVTSSQLAPSPRWAKVIDKKSGPLLLMPDTTDDTIYVDEELNFIINTFGKATTSTGVTNYIMDNEPGLWCDQFPDMRSNCATYNELFTKSIALAGKVKGMDAAANVFGPELYGFTDYWDLQFATDAGDYSDPWLIDSYLKAMKHASDSESRRLLDVFSIHWYTAVPNVGSSDTTMATSSTRMQCTRTLWDSSYVENSWITASGFTNQLPILPHILSCIDSFFPGTKFGMTEYDYGGHGHISGGIAQTDVLGIFGNLGVNYGSIWPAVDGFVKLAFDMYRNYDGKNSTYGGTHVYAASNDTLSTIYSSTDDAASNTLHSIITNKSYTDSIEAIVRIKSGVIYKSVDAYYITQNDTAIRRISIPSSAISNDTFSYTIPPLSIYHFVFKDATALNVNGVYKNLLSLEVAPNPAHNTINIFYNLEDTRAGTITITDNNGKIAKRYNNLAGNSELTVSELPPGNYIIQLSDGVSEKTVRAVIIR